MLLVIEREKGKKILDGYYNTLSYVGYVKRPTVKRYLAWLFLVDFVELIYSHLTDDDYNLINRALACLFDGGSCLLPYSALNNMAHNVSISESQYMGTFNIRITEQNQWRIAEDDNIRVTEG